MIQKQYPPTADPTPSAKVDAEPLPEYVEEFDALLESSVDKYVQLSDQIGGLVGKQVHTGHISLPLLGANGLLTRYSGSGCAERVPRATQPALGLQQGEETGRACSAATDPTDKYRSNGCNGNQRLQPW